MYVLHTMPDSAGVAVHLALQELGLPYDLRMVGRDTGERDTPGYRALHPLGLVPALETPDGPMFETAAILLWLADRHQTLAPATSEADRAAFLTWYFFISSNLHPTLMQLFYPERSLGDTTGEAGLLRTAAARLADQLAVLDAMAARGPRWCSPMASPSIFGYYLAMLLRWIATFAPEHPARLDLAAYPALLTLARALEQRPAALHVARAEGLGPMIFSAPSI
jgi:glutathione S-transferase